MKPSPPSSRVGFTFLEALIALTGAALLVAVSARSMATVFRADRVADQLREASLLLQRVAAEQYLGADLEKPGEEWPANWRMETGTAETGGTDEPQRWETMRCSTTDLSVLIAFRAP